MKQGKIFFTVILLLACFTTALAQAQQCPPLVTAALQAVQDVCADTGRNQACYGNAQLQAEFQPGFANASFSKPGEIINVDGLRTLRSTIADPASQLWGVALMRLQANLPDTLPGQTITMLVLGGTQVENAIMGDPSAPTLKFTAAADAILRAAPTTDGELIGAIVAGDSATALGKSPDGLWLRVELGDRDQRLGWIPLQAADKLDPTTLPAIDPNAPPFSPMQAFYLRPQFSGVQCSDAPNGVLVQSPDNVKVQLTVNEVQIQLGSTVFLQLEPDGAMTVNDVEGDVQVQAGGITVDVPSGYRTRVPLDASQRPTGTPAQAEPLDAAALAALPISLLPNQIAPPAPIWVIGQSLCVNIINGAWLRGAPNSQNQDVVRVLQNGTPAAVADAPQFDGTQTWWPVRTGNYTGWIEQSNLTACDLPVPPPCSIRTDWLFAYTVQPGDTLARIAQAAGLTDQELITGNCLETPYNTPAGTVLRVPRTPIFVTATPFPAIQPPVKTPEVQPPAQTPDSGIVDVVPVGQIIGGSWYMTIYHRACNQISTENQFYNVSVLRGGGVLSLTVDNVPLTLIRGGQTDIYTGSYQDAAGNTYQVSLDPFLLNGQPEANLYIDSACATTG
ncbi:MAG: SH3 domain-containing protein [Chloroflexota bacterium]